MSFNTLKLAFKYLSRRFKQNELLTHAAALSYSTVLGLIPLLALAYFSFSLMDGFTKMESRIDKFLLTNLAPSFAENIRVYIEQIKENLSANAIGAFGILAFAVTSILTISKIEVSLNKIWGVSQARGFLKKIIVYWGVLSLSPILIGTSFYLSTQTMRILRVEGALEWFSFLSGGLLPIVFSGFAFAFLFWLLPNFIVKKRAALVSGMVTAVVFEIAKQLYSYYAAVALGNSLYGSLAVLPVFLVWLYVIWLIVLLGAELSVFLQHKLEGGSWNVSGSLYHPFLMIDILQRVHLQNERSSAQSIKLSTLIKEFEVAPEELMRHLYWLERKQIIVPVKLTDVEGYCYAPSIRDKDKNLEHFLRSFVNYDYCANESWATKIQGQYKRCEFYD